MRIRPDVWIAAYVLQTFAPLGWRPHRALSFATRPVEKTVDRIPTRHGPVRCLVYRPSADTPRPGDPMRPRPVHVQIHGGGFTGRYPEQDDHIATYIASETGAVVVSVDYDVAPQAAFPVAEDECYDVAAWIARNAGAYDWDAGRISVGGESAGGKLAINVCQLAHAAGNVRICALVVGFGVADVSRSDRRSIPGARVSPALQWISNAAYFPDVARRRDPIASPLFDERLAAAMPPALILTGADDTLGPEMDLIAQRLRSAGVPVTHRRFAATDHGFTHRLPLEIAHEAIALIGAHLTEAYTRE